MEKAQDPTDKEKPRASTVLLGAYQDTTTKTWTNTSMEEPSKKKQYRSKTIWPYCESGSPGIHPCHRPSTANLNFQPTERSFCHSCCPNAVLEELHKGHLGVVKMKALARSFVWWPGIDEDIEKIAQQCSGCQMVQNEPERAPLHPWEWPTLPWQRLHIDFAGPFMATTFLVVVDACSKWPEVFTMSSTTTSHTIEVLRDLFARTGVPQQLVSDNGPQFTATDFQVFLHKNGIRHITSAPWHPATNGQAERFVQNLKRALRAMTNEKLTLQQKLANFLFAYRNSIHATTNQTPAMLFFGRPLRSRLDLLQPNIKQTVQDRQIKQGHKATDKVTRSFAIGQSVLARSYRGDQKWVPALVKDQTGPLSYKVEATQGVIWRRPVDQLRKSGLVRAEEIPTLPVDSPAVAPINYPEHLPSPQAAQVQSPCVLSPSPSAEANTAVTIQEKLPCEERRYPIRIRKPPQRLIEN
ncbi:uncharacterized protein K02A2.6-like [Polypterus senegalus]|uniref:uncharacterized protein K02A2.6-like n=1 Tax=Polypterus senegalus TaxID=55291 RepID=UPI001963A19E|nr:uncharacterized protein K02A2.6-like [Polypterus senegalus]